MLNKSNSTLFQISELVGCEAPESDDDLYNLEYLRRVAACVNNLLESDDEETSVLESEHVDASYALRHIAMLVGQSAPEGDENLSDPLFLQGIRRCIQIILENKAQGYP